MSLKFKFFYLPKVHSIYRVHSGSYSLKRIDLYIDELKHWIKKIGKNLKI